MAKIEIDGQAYYVPDRLLTDGRLKVSHIEQDRVPWEQHEAQLRIAEIDEITSGLTMTDQELLDWARVNHPYAEEIRQLEAERAALEPVANGAA